MSKELVKELRATFEYHEDGYLIRKKNGKPCGMRANTCQGYAQVKVNGRMLYAHRIIYALMHSEMPEGEIDHIDGDPLNNRIENLRDVSGSENQHNSKKRKDNSSGFTGVSWANHAQKWRTEIWVDNRKIHLGYFEDFEEAVQARKLAKIRYHPSSPDAQKYVSECLKKS